MSENCRPHGGGIFLLTLYSVSQKIPPCGFLTFFPKRLGIFNQFFTHLLYDPLYTRLLIFIQLPYFQLWWSYAILSTTTRRIFTFHKKFNFYVCLLSKWRHWSSHIRHVYWHYKIVYFIVTCHRQRSTKPSTTYAKVWMHAFRPMVDILSILCELGSRA